MVNLLKNLVALGEVEEIEITVSFADGSMFRKVLNLTDLELKLSSLNEASEAREAREYERLKNEYNLLEKDYVTLVGEYREHKKDTEELRSLITKSDAEVARKHSEWIEKLEKECSDLRVALSDARAEKELLELRLYVLGQREIIEEKE